MTCSFSVARSSESFCCRLATSGLLGEYLAKRVESDESILSLRVARCFLKVWLSSASSESGTERSDSEALVEAGSFSAPRSLISSIS
jgi:hypothetical protein